MPSTVALKSAPAPEALTVAEVGVIKTFGIAVNVIVSGAVADAAEFATETAPTVTVAGAGMPAGAVKTACVVPIGVIVPTVVLPPAILLTCQVTS
jgi:hypothetical protein